MRSNFLAGIYLFKLNDGNTIAMCEICSKLTINTPKRHQWHCPGVFIVNLNRFHTLLWCFYYWLWSGKCQLDLYVYDHVIFIFIEFVFFFVFVFFLFFLYLDFLSQPFTNHRTVGEGGGHFFNCSLPLPPASQTLRHYASNYCRDLTSTHR